MTRGRKNGRSLKTSDEKASQGDMCTLTRVNDVVARVPAKINVILRVGPRRPDGFHGLATAFHAVSLWDTVVASAADDIAVQVGGPFAEGVPDDETNLAHKAVRLFADEVGVARGVQLRIHKGIPVAGGLAGGSADAAAALLACDELWATGVGREALTRIAAEVGSDVPFALYGGTALGSGRGEHLQPLRRQARLHWVVAVAEVGLSTPAVYSKFDELAEPASLEPANPVIADDVLTLMESGSAQDVAGVMGNDLQPAATDLRPQIKRTLDAGRTAGALGGIVSGSGPTSVFLAEDAVHASTLRDRIEKVSASAHVVSGPAYPSVTRV